MEMILISILSCLFTALAWWRLEWAVLVLIAGLPAYVVRFKLLIPFTFLEVMVLVSFAVWILKYTRFPEIIRGKVTWNDIQEERKRRKKYPYAFEIGLLLIIAYTASAVSGFSNEAMGIWKAYFFEPVLVFLLVLNIFKEKGGVKKIILALSVSILAVSIFSIYQKVTGAFIPNEFWSAEATRRSTSFFGYPNAVGLYLGPLLLVMAGYLAEKIRKPGELKNNKLLILYLTVVIILGLLSVYFAKSEGAAVAVAVAFILCGFLATKHVRIITIIFLVVFMSGIMLFQPSRDYFVEKFTLGDLSGEIRKQQWRETWTMLTDGHLLFGSGLANYQSTIAPYHQEGIFFNSDRDPDFQRKIVIFNEEYKEKYWQPTEIYMYPHNIVLNFWAELGILGALMFIWLIGKYFIKAYGLLKAIKTNAWIRDNRPHSAWLVIGLIGAMVAIVVHGLVDVPYFKNDLAILFWLLLALLSLVNSNMGFYEEKKK